MDPSMSSSPSYNHNIAYAGHTFHVQTEVSGGTPGAVVTHIFLAGDIIATSRAPLQLDGQALEHDTLVARMQKQHQDAMRMLIGGAHNATLQARGVPLALGTQG
jgi:hypothetical protein